MSPVLWADSAVAERDVNALWETRKVWNVEGSDVRERVGENRKRTVRGSKKYFMICGT